MKRHYRPDPKSKFLLNITPETAQWKYISFKVVRLSPNESGENRMVDIDDPLRILRQKLRWQNLHVTRQHDEIGLVLAQ